MRRLFSPRSPTYPSIPPSSTSSILLMWAIALCLLTYVTCVSAEPRAFPSTKRNQKFFNMVQGVISQGNYKVENCDGNQEQRLRSCLEICLSPGPVKRDDCCCSAAKDDLDNNKLNIGLSGSCRYHQKLLNYSSDDLIRYESRPLDAPPLFNDASCAPTNDGNDLCGCVLTWSAKWSIVSQPSPSPTVTPTPSMKPPASPKPTMAPSLSITPIPSGTMITSPSASVSMNTAAPSTTDGGSGGNTGSRGPVGGGSTGDGDNSTPSPNMDDDDGDDNNTSGSGSGTDGGPQSSPDSGDDGDGDGNGGICVDEHYLLDRGFKREDMVHVEGVRAAVWCPQYEGLPCGTEFHKVKINGRSMSYRQLCEDEGSIEGGVECRRDVKIVNSVWTHVWSGVGHGQVELTMYDVRYSETGQRVLHRVMRSVRQMVQ